jgi:hypothetical protein
MSQVVSQLHNPLCNRQLYLAVILVVNLAVVNVLHSQLRTCLSKFLHHSLLSVHRLSRRVNHHVNQANNRQGITVDSLLDNQHGNQQFNLLDSQADNQPRNQAGSPLDNQAGNQPRDPVGNHHVNRAGSQLDNLVGNPLDSPLGSQLGSQAGSQADSPLLNLLVVPASNHLPYQRVSQRLHRQHFHLLHPMISPAGILDKLSRFLLHNLPFCHR